MAIWKTKIRQHGDKLAAAIIAGFGVSAVQAQRELGLKPGSLPLSHTVVEPQSVADLREGFSTAIIDQQLYSHGYVSAAHAWQFVEAGFYPPLYYESGNVVIDKNNAADVEAREKRLVAQVKKYGLKP